jgi:hypothetical protein
MRHLHTGLTCHKPANGLVCHRLFQFGFSFGCAWSGGKRLVQINSLIGSVCVRDRDLDSPQGVNLDGLFVWRVESMAKNSKLAHEHKEHKEHDEFIPVRASEE